MDAGVKKVSLHFPNAIRSYNGAHHDITFWWHDTALEITFVIELAALQFMRGDKSTVEQELTHIFDQNVSLIHAAAKRIYEKKKGGFIRLSADDF